MSANLELNLIYDNKNIDLRIVINPNLKRISLAASMNKGVVLKIARKSQVNSAKKFALKNIEWIIEKNKLLEEARQNHKIGDGSLVLVGGKEYKVSYSGNIRGVTIANDNDATILVNGDPKLIGKNVERYLRSLASSNIEKLCVEYAQIINVEYKNISIKDTSSIWGSCSYDNSLSFSFRLAMAPFSVMQYVVIHELCHIIEKNHSKDFWLLVAKYCPNYQISRRWLKANGSLLKRSIF